MTLRGHKQTAEHRARKGAAVHAAHVRKNGDTKLCPRCNVVKARSEFGVRSKSRSKTLLISYCLPCDREVRCARQRAVTLKRFHGITVAQFDALSDSQGHRCAICGCKPERLFVDHCHETNAIRGLLCGLCNTGVGMFKNDPVRMQAAADYVTRDTSTSLKSVPGMPSGFKDRKRAAR